MINPYTFLPLDLRLSRISAEKPLARKQLTSDLLGQTLSLHDLEWTVLVVHVTSGISYRVC